MLAQLTGPNATSAWAEFDRVELRKAEIIFHFKPVEAREETEFTRLTIFCDNGDIFYEADFHCVLNVGHLLSANVPFKIEELA
jgi:hypothetical protein